MAPLLSTKLYVPPTRPGLVTRPRLIERLNAGLHCPLTLISAPAGFGKTTLLSDWAQGAARAIAWLSLDEGDNDPARFLAYLIAALQAAEQNGDPHIGQTTLGALQSPQLPPLEELLTPLLNEISVTVDPLVLILDDYHVIRTQTIHKMLAFLIDHLPPSMHITIATRSDPPLPIARLRGRGQVHELRQADLRFTLEEATEFLGQFAELELDPSQVAVLGARTEGWVAGLQMAVLAMQGIPMHGRRDVGGFVEAFAGSNRYILDYLIQEVLQRQPASIQTFLLHTSILQRMSGPLCDALLKGEPDPASAIRHAGEKASDRVMDDGQTVLEYLEHSNLFVVPLDGQRKWYRYHHLWADLLRHRLQQTSPDLIPVLHGRASAWYEDQGLEAEAIEHALLAGEQGRAAQLLDDHAEALWGRGEQATMARWLQALPEEVVLGQPRLCVYHALSLVWNGRLEQAAAILQAVEQAGSATPEASTRHDTEQQGMIATVRAYIAYFGGDAPNVVACARQALACLPRERSMLRSAAASAMGDAYSLSGQLDQASQAYAEAIALAKAAHNAYFVLLASLKLATNLVLQDEISRAIEMCKEQLEYANESGFAATARVGGILSVWASLLRTRGDLDQAVKLAQQSLEFSKQGSNVVMTGMALLVLARILFSRGDLAGAEQKLHQLQATCQESDLPIWLTSPLAAWKARLKIAQGRPEDAARLLHERGINVENNYILVRIDEHISLARLLIARATPGSDLPDALHLLGRLQAVSEQRGIVGKSIEVAVLEALAWFKCGDLQKALSSLDGALSMARQESHVQVFVDEGQPMAELLYKAASQGISPHYAGLLLTAFEDLDRKGIASKPTAPSLPEWMEPLSERERQVLDLVAQGLTNREIARALTLSISTIKSHTHNLYGKLDVHSRTQAVAKARALGILPSPQ